MVITEQGKPIAWDGIADPTPLLRAVEGSANGAVVTGRPATGPPTDAQPARPAARQPLA